MKKVCLIALLMSSSAAFGADLTRSSAPYVPPPSLTWSGAYVGANVGYGWANTSNSIFGVDFPLNVPTSPRGFLAGGYAGYQYEFGMWLAGLETDLSWSNISDDDIIKGHIDPDKGGSIPWALQVNNRLTWLGTARGRVGFLPLPRLLLYGTGGLAYGGVNSDATLAIGSSSLNASFAQTWSAQDTRVGWAAGGGAEYAMTPNVSVRTEFLHYDLGKVSHQIVPDISATTDANGNLVRMGLGYKF